MPSAEEKAEAKKRNQQAIAILRIGRPFQPQVIDQPEPEVGERQQHQRPFKRGVRSAEPGLAAALGSLFPL